MKLDKFHIDKERDANTKQITKLKKEKKLLEDKLLITKTSHKHTIDELNEELNCEIKDKEACAGKCNNLKSIY